MAGLHPAERELVGRHAELAMAGTALRAGARGELGALLVRGSAGLGKSALCRRIAAQARDEGRSVVMVGGMPYPEVIAFADALGAEADRLGAARGRAFATTLRGEAMLLTGRLDEADTDLAEGVRLHRAIGAPAGETIALQRRAEVALYRGDRAQAMVLLDESLTVARESDLGFHLLDRIDGTMITAATDPGAAMAALEEAESAVHGSLETCPGCRITLAVPAATAAARAGDLERAAGYEGEVEHLTSILMRLPGWYAAFDEVRGHRAAAAGNRAAAVGYYTAAATTFREAGQPLDATRCTASAAGLG